MVLQFEQIADGDGARGCADDLVVAVVLEGRAKVEAFAAPEVPGVVACHFVVDED